MGILRDTLGRVLIGRELNWERWRLTRRRKLLPQSKWTAVNTSTVTWTVQRDKSVTLYNSGSAGPNIAAYVRTAPATPWEVIVNVRPMCPTDSLSPQHAGVLFRESSTGRLHTLSIQNDGNWHIGRYTSPTALSLEDLDSGSTLPTFSKTDLWFRIRDDGTDRLFYVSNDCGWTWYSLFSVGRTTFLTADQYGIFVNDEASFGLYATFSHLEPP